MTDETETTPLRPLELRVARVVEARAHPNADRLLVLDIDLGEERRQIVAGIAQHYTPETLAGRHIVVVANLQAARLRGEISQGMLLAAQGEGTLGLVQAEAPAGTRLTTRSMGVPAGEITIGEFAAHALESTPAGVTVDGEPLEGAPVAADRGVHGKVR